MTVSFNWTITKEKRNYCLGKSTLMMFSSILRFSIAPHKELNSFLLLSFNASHIDIKKMKFSLRSYKI